MILLQIYKIKMNYACLHLTFLQILQRLVTTFPAFSLTLCFSLKETVKPSPFDITICLLACCEVTVRVTAGDGYDGFPSFLPIFLKNN